ncbi:MAG TPA: ABC transporter permease [Vicinamibacterales bacterium]|nr:ABC transporter permease [Vicinamibacterales bacterium]
MAGGGGLLALILAATICAPFFISGSPTRLNLAVRLTEPGSEYWFGTDMYGRDIYARTLHGGRISLAVALSVSLLTTVFGVSIGLVSGYSRLLDGIIMRIVDGMMAIPAILVAIALMALMRASLQNVIIAITVSEVPRMIRLVRSVVLTLREQTYVEAATAVGAGRFRNMVRHIVPNTLGPIIVQATYVMAVAVIIEAYLSFLGAGTPPDVPTWGNIMAEGRALFQLAFWIILFPGLFLAVTVLGFNLIGDGLRDALDPRLSRSI